MTTGVVRPTARIGDRDIYVLGTGGLIPHPVAHQFASLHTIHGRRHVVVAPDGDRLVVHAVPDDCPYTEAAGSEHTDLVTRGERCSSYVGVR